MPWNSKLQKIGFNKLKLIKEIVLFFFYEMSFPSIETLSLIIYLDCVDLSGCSRWDLRKGILHSRKHILNYFQ